MMHLTGSSLLSFLLYSTACVAESLVGHVYLYDRNPPAGPSTAQSIKPETASLIFAQRLGVSQFESIGSTDENALQQLNLFGGRWQKPFHLEKQAAAPSRRVIVFVEGIRDTKDFIDCQSAAQCPYSEFKMTSPPSIAENEELLSHFRTLSTSLYPPGSYSSGHARFHELLKPLQKLNHDDLVTSVHDNVFIHVDTAKVMTESYEDTADFLHSAISNILQLAQHEDMSLTIALFPSTSGNAKRSTNSYGKRDSKQVEEPLKVSSVPSGKSSPVQLSQNDPVAPLASGSLVKGIIPSCFSTLGACQSSTANCTGHGACYLKYTDKSHGNRQCWTCGCKASVTTNKRGLKQTTHGGGGACQKKDVAVQFWILAGFTILLVGTISWGIRLLYSMGEEELPSVIGAGVSGPKAK